MSRRPTPTILVILLAALAVAGSSFGRAEEPARPAAIATEPRNLRAALEEVGSLRFAERDSASSYLLHQRASALPEVEACLAREADPEVITRLTFVAVHLYMKSLTSFSGRMAMLGIAFSVDAIRSGPDSDDYQMAIAVSELQPGFPAAELLKVGDRIIGINGESFGSDYTVEDFRSKVAKQTPGTALRFTVLRGNEQQQIAVPLVAITDADDSGTFIANRNVAIENYLSQLKTGTTAGVVIPGALPEISPAPYSTQGLRFRVLPR